ncbi:hypothetical protein AAE478_000690 [Parahypoxylon ruwenzoriense]
METGTLPHAHSAKEDSSVMVRVGQKEYLVDVNKIPYFASFLRFQHSSGQDSATSLPTHGDIPFFDIINYGIDKGFRQFFRRMPAQLTDYHTLCETLDFLCVDVASCHKLRDIMQDFKESNLRDWDPEERREIRGDRKPARDSAFRLLYLFLLGDFESDVRDSNAAYQATLFVVSHRGIFKQRTRKMVREAYEERFRISEKQLKGLNRWTIEHPSPESLEHDATTESEEVESDRYWDPDWSS